MTSARKDNWAMTKKEYDDYCARFRAGMTNLRSMTTTDEESYFSWIPCQICGTTLGGNRQDAYAIMTSTSTNEIIELSICDDCVYFNEYGQLDDMTMIEVAQDEEKLAAEDKRRIEEILCGYIATALWSSSDDDDAPLGANYDQSNIAESALKQMRDDCKKFYADNKADCVLACEEGGLLIHEMDQWERIGRDFWFTRNGHGVGFWDGDYVEELGQRLTTASKVFGESHLYVGDDGMIYEFHG
jgi:hypothetical protein